MRSIQLANFVYAAILVISGVLLLLGNLVELGDWHISATVLLIAGLILPFFSKQEYAANRLVLHIILVFIILIGILTGFLFLYGFSEGVAFIRERVIYIVVSIASFVLMVIYIAKLLDLKRLKRLKNKF